MEEILEEYSIFCKEIEALDSEHDDYLKSLVKISDQQVKEKKLIKELTTRIQKFGKSTNVLRKDENISESEKRKLGELLFESEDCKQHLYSMLDELPRGQNGAYLSVILGSTLDVSLMNKAAKFRYKDEYEKFKLSVTIAIIVVVTIAYFSALRVTDAMCQFLLVWYYCTLTIREAILQVNGSKIKGWWLAHHYVSTVLFGVMLTWPDTQCYREFRWHFLAHEFYVAIVQLLQVRYQRGCLRRLRSLGQRHAMDITVDGFHSWMFRGLTFLLPFLCIAYVFQLYIAIFLATLWWSSCNEWQSLALALLFLTVSLGNSSTTMSVIYRKFTADKKFNKDLLRRKLTTKYSSTIPLNPKSPTDRIDGATMETIFQSSDSHSKKCN